MPFLNIGGPRTVISHNSSVPTRMLGPAMVRRTCAVGQPSPGHRDLTVEAHADEACNESRSTVAATQEQGAPCQRDAQIARQRLCSVLRATRAGMAHGWLTLDAMSAIAERPSLARTWTSVTAPG